jgi:hypothetical protein
MAPIRDAVRAFGTVAAEAEPPEVRDARTALTEAEARRALAARQVHRLEALAGGLAPRKDLDAARAEETSAAAAAARARNVLAAFGEDAGRPALGVNERWIVGRLMQVDVPRVAAGAQAAFLADAFAGERFEGRVDGGPAYVDPVTFTAPLRLRVQDPGDRLRPGMTGALLIEVGAPREALVVPASALVYDHAEPVVFVEKDGRYERRSVKPGVMRDGRVEIAAGIAPGEPVVVTGAPSLLSATRLPAGEGD